MPHSVSAAKRVRQNLKQRLKNRKVKSEMKSLTKNLLGLIQAKKKEEAATTFRTLASRFDRAAKKGIIHHRNADRHKSRLARRLTKAFA